MPYTLSTSRFSFLQFGQTDLVTACNWTDTENCLPVYDIHDVAFQFIMTADTEEEADALCSQASDPVRIGHVESCSDALTPFAGIITRYRISTTQVLYYWGHGITTLNDMQVGDCFRIGVEVFDQFFCSNCFKRIGSDCHTSVLEYYNSNDNAFGFSYCLGPNDEASSDTGTCEPLIIQFTNEATYTLVWTAYLRDRYGDAPLVQAWIYDGGELVAAGIVIKFDNYPPNNIIFDFGGVASGVLRIS